MYQEILEKEKIISVIGLGYVGLPIALAFAKKVRVIGFDINADRVKMMQNKEDPSRELSAEAFENSDITFTANIEDLCEAHFHIVAVPTPIDEHRIPNLGPLLAASKTVGQILKKGDYVIFESTVYPGCTEEDCLPILEKESGLKLGDFKIGYSPERINPGDTKHTLEKIVKVVSGSDAMAADEIAKVYELIIEAGVHRASTIKVAEAAKVIENTQRDLNIALMNELSIIFDKMKIDTWEVLEAAGTKWNFLPFFPGLVGGHCIGVDPYYLTYKSEKLGYKPQVILSGRRINDGMSQHLATKTVQLLIKAGKNPKDAKVLIMGVTFKENVSDIRNSKVASVISALNEFEVQVDSIDPFANAEEVVHEYGFRPKANPDDDYDAIIVAVSHDAYRDLKSDDFKAITTNNPILIDVKGIYRETDLSDFTVWRF